MGACAFLLPIFFSFTLCFVFSDVLMSGIWNEVGVLEDPSLRSLVPDLLDLQMGSRASSTVTKYKSGWLRWRLGVFEDWRVGYSCEAFAYCAFYYGAY